MPTTIAHVAAASLYSVFNVEFLTKSVPVATVVLVISSFVLIVLVANRMKQLDDRLGRLESSTTAFSSCMADNKNLPESIGTNFNNLKKKLEGVCETLEGYASVLQGIEAMGNCIHDDWRMDAERRSRTNDCIVAIHEKITDKTTAGVQEKIQSALEAILPMVQRLVDLHPLPKWENGERPVHWCAINDVRPTLAAISEQLGEQRRTEQDDLTNLLMLVRLVGTLIEKIDRLHGLVWNDRVQRQEGGKPEASEIKETKTGEQK